MTDDGMRPVFISGEVLSLTDLVAQKPEQSTSPVMSAKSMMSRYSSTSSTASTRMQVDECKAKIIEALELKR